MTATRTYSNKMYSKIGNKFITREKELVGLTDSLSSERPIKFPGLSGRWQLVEIDSSEEGITICHYQGIGEVFGFGLAVVKN